MESREEAPKSLITKGGARGKGTGGFGFGFGWRYLGLSHPRPAPRALGPGSLLSTATVTPARLEELPSPTEATGLEASGEAQWRSGSVSPQSSARASPSCNPEYVVVSTAGTEFFLFSEFYFSCH